MEETVETVLGRAVATAAQKQLEGSGGEDAGEFDLERWAQEMFSDEPFLKLVALVGLGAWAFYKAELGHNDKVTSYWDALVYVSTCMSVGYGDIFARTPVGKIIGSITMTIGPAMANAAYDGKRRDRDREAEEDRRQRAEMLETLKQILVELRARA